nr:HNH endonuclease [Alcaligenes faecalis]
MREPLLRMEFFETYYYANVVHNVLNDTLPYLRNLNSWHEGREAWLFLRPFPKWSVLHDFAQYIIEDLIYERLQEVSLEAIENSHWPTLWIDQALAHHQIETPGFRAWLKQEKIDLADASQDVIHDYYNELRLTGEFDTLLTQLTNEVFYLLFGNRTLLTKLNSYVSGVVESLTRNDLVIEKHDLLRKDGIPARTHIPEWARRAIYFRDRGMCASCNTDLTGIISINNAKHYDHMIPLAAGGINDITNLQLLCGLCNLKKGRRMLPTSTNYQSWYASDA